MNRKNRAPIGILKMGSAEPEIRERLGDFTDWMRASLDEETRALAGAIDPSDGLLPEPAGLRAVIITGSYSMVTDPSAIERAAFRWMECVLAAGVPVLGICYGHQMLGHVLGGEVGPLPGGPEIGVVEVRFDAGEDPLFAPCGATQQVAAIHWQSVRRLPAGARVFGRSAREPHHAVRYASRVWGVQFHPEFSPAVMAENVRRQAGVLRELGQPPEAMAAAAERWRETTAIVARFVRLALGG